MDSEKLRQEIYRRMTPGQKWAEVLKLRDAAWQLKEVGIKAEHPDWGDKKIQEAVKNIFRYATT